MARNTAACDRCDTRVACALQRFGLVEQVQRFADERPQRAPNRTRAGALAAICAARCAFDSDSSHLRSALRI
jgi:hypothetical protein